MKIGPVVLFEPTAEDNVYCPVFMRAFQLLQPVPQILGNEGMIRGLAQHVPAETWEEAVSRMEANIQILTTHVLEVQAAHNRLVDLWPRKAFQAPHRLLVGAIKSYGFALVEDIKYRRAILNEALPPKTGSRYRRDAMQWDKLAAEYLVKLVKKLRNMQAVKTTGVNSLVSDTDLGGMDKMLNSGFRPGTFIT